MANEYTNTEAATGIPALVKAEALAARYARAVIVSRVLHEDREVAAHGDQVSINIIPTLTVNNVGSDGSVTNQNPALTESIITIDKWKETTLDIVDKAKKQSKVDIMRSFSVGFGQALAEQQDIDLASEFSNLSFSAGTDGAGGTADPFDDAMARHAKKQLDEAKVPQEGRFWVLSVSAELDLLALARFSEAQNTGFRMGAQIENGSLSKLYGYPVVVTPNVQVTANSNEENALLHREALGIATQSNFEMEMFARTKYSTPMSANILYGVKTLRANHGVKIFSKTFAG